MVASWVLRKRCVSFHTGLVENTHDHNPPLPFDNFLDTPLQEEGITWNVKLMTDHSQEKLN